MREKQLRVFYKFEYTGDFSKITEASIEEVSSSWTLRNVRVHFVLKCLNITLIFC